MIERHPPRRWRLGEILVQKGWITWEELEAALKIQQETRAEMTNILSDMGVVTKKNSQVLNLGEILVRQKKITWKNLEMALEIQQSTRKVLGEILVDWGLITRKDVYRALAEQFYMAYVDFDSVNVPREILDLIPKAFAAEYKMMPLVKKENILLIAISDPLDVRAESVLRQRHRNLEVRSALAPHDEIEKAIERFYGPT